MAETAGWATSGDNLILDVDTGKVWWITGGKKRWITTLDIFNAWAKTFGLEFYNDVKMAHSDWSGLQVPQGANITAWPEEASPEPTPEPSPTPSPEPTPPYGSDAGSFFFNKWLEKYRDYSDYPSDRLDVDADVAHGLYLDYLVNNNTASLNKAIDIMSKATARFYNRYVETSAWLGDWHREAELGEFLRTFGEMADVLPADINEPISRVTEKVANYFLDINKVRNRYQGNTAAEENAWIAMFLAQAANLYSDNPNSADWDKFARTFAYHSITTSGDSAYGGIKTQTVYDDFVMDNHDLHPNCIYPIWTLNYLGEAAQAYLENGKEIPWEFQHNTANLWNKTKSYINIDGDTWAGSYGDTGEAQTWPPSWIVPSFWPYVYLATGGVDPDYGDMLLNWRYENKSYSGQWGGSNFGYITDNTLRGYAEGIGRMEPISIPEPEPTPAPTPEPTPAPTPTPSTELGKLFPDRPAITPPEIQGQWGQRPFEATWPGGKQLPGGIATIPEREPYERPEIGPVPLPSILEGDGSTLLGDISGQYRYTPSILLGQTGGDFYSLLNALGESLILSQSQTEALAQQLGG